MATGGLGVLEDHTGVEDRFEMERARFETAEEGQVEIVGGHFEIEAEGRLVGIVEDHSGKVRAHPETEEAHCMAGGQPETVAVGSLDLRMAEIVGEVQRPDC